MSTTNSVTLEQRISATAPWPYFGPDEVQAATRVLESGRVNYWTGVEGREFEHEFADYVGSKHAIALANGTVALELALRVLGIGPGDEVITTPRTFIASASCAVAVGAKPVVADVDPESQNLTAETIARVLTECTRAIIAVHLAGWPCEMDDILELARGKGIYVIEDCAQAHGATHRGRRVGSIGDIGTFSFCQDKIMTTAGEGGMITLNSPELFERAWSYKDHGKSYDAVFRRHHAPGFRWLHESWGTNWRLSEVQSAVGRVQLGKLPRWVKSRQRNAQLLNQLLSEAPGLRLTIPPSHIEHSYYKYYAFVRPEDLKSDWDRDRIVAEMAASGVPCSTGSCSEIYLEKAFPPNWRPTRRLPIASELGATSIMLLVHPTLTSGQIEVAAKVFCNVMKRACKSEAK